MSDLIGVYGDMSLESIFTVEVPILMFGKVTLPAKEPCSFWFSLETGSVSRNGENCL